MDPDDLIKVDFAAIRARLFEKRLRMSHLARASKIHQSCLSLILSGYMNPGFKVASRLRIGLLSIGFSEDETDRLLGRRPAQ